MSSLSFVLDASVTLCWAFPDESEPVGERAAEILQSPGGSAVVPALWWYEIRNVLIVGERRGRITPDGTAFFLNQVKALRIVTAPAPDDGVLLDLARRMKLTVYDAAYLALAIERNLPLATSDKTLQSAARANQIRLLQ
jgi:predicted nucleic acid-binding protein